MLFVQVLNRVGNSSELHEDTDDGEETELRMKMWLKPQGEIEEQIEGNAFGSLAQTKRISSSFPPELECVNTGAFQHTIPVLCIIYYAYEYIFVKINKYCSYNLYLL